MKILKATTAYKSYLDDFFKRNRELTSKSYLEQSSSLFNDVFGWADFWEKSLAPLGWQVFEVVANAKSIQTTWAREQGWQPSRKNWITEILLRQIQFFQPEILFFDNHNLLTANDIKALREQCKSIRFVISWCGAPFSNTDDFSQHDLVLSCVPEIVSRLRQIGCNSEHLNHAFYPDLLRRIKSIEEPSIPLSFIGQIVSGSQQHLERARVLKAIIDSKLPLEIYTPSHSWSLKDKSKMGLKKLALLTFPTLDKIEHQKNKSIFFPLAQKIQKWQEKEESVGYEELVAHFKRPVFGLEMFKTLRKSQVTFNCHIDISEKSASNMRLFESTGVGSCLLTDDKENLNSLFEPDYEVVTYSSSEECIEKATWLIENPEKRQEIAKAGQKRTLEYHSFDKRAVDLIDIVKKYL